MAGYGTPFQETEVLLAVGQGDTEYAREVLGGMLPGERRLLARTARRLAALCEEAE